MNDMDIEDLLSRLRSFGLSDVKNIGASDALLAANEIEANKRLIRNLEFQAARLYYSSGCECCRINEMWDDASDKLVKLLSISELPKSECLPGGEVEFAIEFMAMKQQKRNDDE